jgi:two-component system, NarL family, invasion response regulator UvrY
MLVNQKLTVGIADDHNLIRKALVNLINSFENYCITVEASSGNALLNKLSTIACPDIIILDIIMKDGNGYDAVKRLRMHYPNVRILALSMCVETDSVIRMYKLGARGFISKNMEPDDLRNALDRVAKNEIHVPEEYTNLVFNELIESPGKKEININDRELKFLTYLSTDMTYKEIAYKMFISPKTIDDYKSNLCSKLKIKSRTGLVAYAIKNGLIEI